MDKSREEFIVFVRTAVNDRESVAAQELYQFLTSCFLRADANLDGRVEIDEFDQLIEEAAALPRRYGFAPKSEDMYPSEALRKEARKQMFYDMDRDGKG